MPVINVSLMPGDPTIETNGEYRGTVQVEFDDGRIISRNMRAPDEDSWSAKMLGVQGAVEAEAQQKDAIEAAENDVEILGQYREADKRQQALAYLRKAMQIGNPYLAYQKFARFNSWRLSEGYSIPAVKTALAAVGLEDDEWVDMSDRFQYLSNSARITAMQAYQGVVDGDTWGAKYR